MFKRLSSFVTFMLIVTLALVALVGCGSEEDNPASSGTGGGAGGGASSAAALEITGKVDTEMGWSEDEVRAMDTIEAESVNKAGEASTYTGVLLNTLLDLAGVQTGATKLVFVGDNGTEAEVDLAKARACADCIISFRNQGGFSMVMPDFPGNVEVKGVVIIRIE